MEILMVVVESVDERRDFRLRVEISWGGGSKT